MNCIIRCPAKKPYPSQWQCHSMGGQISEQTTVHLCIAILTIKKLTLNPKNKPKLKSQHHLTP